MNTRECLRPMLYVTLLMGFAVAGYAKPAVPDFTKGATVDLTKEGTPVDWNLGATGARGWVYGWFGSTSDSRQILITSVHQGTPADGVLRKGDVVLGIGDKAFDSDARISFAKALTRAETQEGKGELTLLRWRAGETASVTIQIPVLGSYSKATPWECEKSMQILDRACAYLIRNGITTGGAMGIPAMVRSLALMSTGDERYMPVVREHIDLILSEVAKSGDQPPSPGLSSWYWGYTNLLLTEYHLLTGDNKVLPAIRKYSMALAMGQACSGTWGHGMAPPDKITGKPHGALGGYGSMNQASTICWMSLILAKRCGVTHPEIEQAIARSHRFLSDFIDMGGITYGDNLPMSPRMHDDNGKTSAAAVAFAIYGDAPGTSFFSRMTVASHGDREYGHTGNYFNFLWGALGAARAGKLACGEFLRAHRWLYDLERRWDGGFEYQGQGGNGNGYDPVTGRQRNNAGHQNSHWDTTGSRILMYCLPRRKLLITGRDILTIELTPAEVADAIEAPHRKHGGHYTREQHLERLGSWSPVVREWSAQEVASRVKRNVEGYNLDSLVDMLHGSDKYARYGSCRAMTFLGTVAKPTVDDLIACLDAEDRVLRINAIRALATTDDARAAKALLELASRDFPKDTFDTTRRYVAMALFEPSGSLIEKSFEADRKLLLAAVRRLLHSMTGHCRTVVAKNVLEKLTFAEVMSIMPDLDYAFNATATTYNTAIQVETLRLMAVNHVGEGIDKCVWYLTNMKGHGSEKRVPEVLGILRRYGAHAKRTIPKLKEVADYFENREENFPKNLSIGKAKAVRETIRLLEAMDDREKPKIRLISLTGD